MPVAGVAWLTERSPVLLAAAAVVNLGCAIVVALDGAWPFVALFSAVAILFAAAAFREASRKRGAHR